MSGVKLSDRFNKKFTVVHDTSLCEILTKLLRHFDFGTYKAKMQGRKLKKSRYLSKAIAILLAIVHMGKEKMAKMRNQEKKGER